MLVDGAAAVEAGMGGHKPEAHLPAAEATAAVVAHQARGVGFVDVVHVAIHRVEAAVGGKFGGNGAQNVVRGVEIVAVENSHHVACGGGDALVHGVVDSAVGFGDYAQTPLEASFEAAADVQRVIAAASVFHYQFVVAVVLRQHALERVCHCATAIKRSRNNRDFHSEFCVKKEFCVIIIVTRHRAAALRFSADDASSNLVARYARIDAIRLEVMRRYAADTQH